MTGDSDLSVCWMKNGRIPGVKFAQSDEESDRADCGEIKAALDEIDAEANLGEGSSGFRKLPPEGEI